MIPLLMQNKKTHRTKKLKEKKPAMLGADVLIKTEWRSITCRENI